MPDDSSSELTRDQQAAALALAERTVEFGVYNGEPLEVTGRISELFPDGKRATFVSLYVENDLNGCVGRLQPSRRIEKDIVHNAFRAAFRDRRFPALEPEDLEDLQVEISVLDPLERIPAECEDEIWEWVEPHRHGLLLETEQHRGTFLPSVWEKCSNPDQFLVHLKRKAGLPIDAWPEDLRVYRYTVDAFDRETLSPPLRSSDSTG